MSSFSFRQALGLEKPHSSITDWVDILTSTNFAEEAYDGIPELVDSINLQATGPAEASRALRKKLKHGNPHQQYRALVLVKALVENCGSKFQATFSDGQLSDVFKNISGDPTADKRVKKKLLLVLASWREQFKSDPSMALFAGLYNQCNRESRRLSQQELSTLVGLSGAEDKKRAEKEEAKKKAKREKEEAKERARKEDQERQQKERNAASRPKRTPFNFEKDKPKVLASIVDASQATSNLHNAITLVNPETDNLQTNERVQECITKAKQARKPVVRYIQLVENEELIGTLIETNERIIAALETYDRLVAQNSDSATNVSGVTKGLAATQISTPESEVNRLQERQRAAVDGMKEAGDVKDKDADPYADLQNLDFGGGPNNLQPPLIPSTFSDDGQDERTYDVRGSLSEFSDYDSSDEETHGASGSSPRKRGGRDYVNVSDDPEDENYPGPGSVKAPLVNADDDPFADPFADEVAVGPAKKW